MLNCLRMRREVFFFLFFFLAWIFIEPINPNIISLCEWMQKKIVIFNHTAPCNWYVNKDKLKWLNRNWIINRNWIGLFILVFDEPASSAEKNNQILNDAVANTNRSFLLALMTVIRPHCRQRRFHRPHSLSLFAIYCAHFGQQILPIHQQTTNVVCFWQLSSSAANNWKSYSK